LNFGAEPKKVAILAGLVLIAAVALYVNSTGDSAPAPAPRVAARPVSAAVPESPDKSTSARVRGGGRAAVGEFRFRIPGSRPADKFDPSAVDPELRLDLLARVQAVEPVAAGRNLFQFGAAPQPDKPLPPVPANVPRILVNQPQPGRPMGQPGGVTGAMAQGVVPVTPINLKYYGILRYVGDGRKQAMLLDGDDIIVAEENQTVKQRYRIVRIAQTSIVIEDMQSKSTQTLSLQEIPG
jgi:hypothetical protein